MKKIFIAFAIIATAIVGIGSVLSKDYKVSRSIVIEGTPAQIYPFLNDLEKWDAWTPWRDGDPTMKTERGEISQGVGATQKWQGDSGSGRLEFTESDPQKGISYTLYFNDDIQPSTSTMSFESQAQGTKVVWEMSGTVQMPVLGGFLALSMDRMAGDMFQAGLSKLKTVVEAQQSLDSATSVDSDTTSSGDPSEAGANPDPDPTPVEDPAENYEENKE